MDVPLEPFPSLPAGSVPAGFLDMSPMPQATQATQGPQGPGLFRGTRERAPHLRAAYGAAFMIAQDVGSPSEHMPTHELGQQLARLIILAAWEGIANIDQLKTRALCAMPAFCRALMRQRTVV